MSSTSASSSSSSSLFLQSLRGRWRTSKSMRKSSHPISNKFESIPFPTLSDSSTFLDLVRVCCHRLRRAIDEVPPNHQIIIGIAGPPGGGKSTLSLHIRKQFRKAPTNLEIGIIPMDGYHYYKKQLQKFQDPENAFARRGAPFTFDSERFVKDIIALRTTSSGFFPSFSHGVGDPIEEDVEISKKQKIVLVEGNYLFLSEQPWLNLLDSECFDETWYVNCSVEEATKRVIARQIRTGKPREEAERRAYTNDMRNAKLIDKSKRFADIMLLNPQNFARSTISTS